MSVFYFILSKTGKLIFKKTYLLYVLDQQEPKLHRQVRILRE
jgi:hypothetical protein